MNAENTFVMQIVLHTCCQVRKYGSLSTDCRRLYPSAIVLDVINPSVLRNCLSAIFDIFDIFDTFDTFDTFDIFEGQIIS